MIDYSELDKQILLAVKNGNCTFVQINGKVRVFAAPHSLAEPWRVVDRRLQSLRKAGKLSYTRAEGWVLCD